MLALNKTILALALVAILAGCDTTSSSSVPSGAEAPRLTLTVISAIPTDNPIIQIEWEHQDSVSIYATERWRFDFDKWGQYSTDAKSLIVGTQLGSDGVPKMPGIGKIQVKAECRDSATVEVGVYIMLQTPLVQKIVRLKCR